MQGTVQVRNSILFLLAPALALQLQQAALAQAAENAGKAESLSGHLVKSDSPSHLARPLRNKAKSSSPAVRPEPDSKIKSIDFDLNQRTSRARAEAVRGASLFSNQEAGSEQQLSETKEQKEERTNGLKALDLCLEERTEAGVIRWDDWHRRLVENLYLRFHRANNGDYPGECRILVTVSKTGQLSIRGGEDFFKQSQEFQDTLNRAARLLCHSSTLEFPEGSRRSLVEFTISVRSSKEKGMARYGWTTGDLEKIPAH